MIEFLINIIEVMMVVGIIGSLLVGIFLVIVKNFMPIHWNFFLSIYKVKKEEALNALQNKTKVKKDDTTK